MKDLAARHRLALWGAWITLLGIVVPGCGEDSSPPPADLPPDPVPLRVSIGALSNALNWNPSNAPDFGAYVIRRRGDGSASNVLATLDAVRDTSWVDATVSPHRAYEYSVQVEDRAGQVSAASLMHVTTIGLDSLTVGLHPRTHVAEPGDTVTVSLWVEGAVDLFGAVVGLSFDEQQLVLVGCRTGLWLGTETLLLCQDEKNGVTLAATRLGNAPSLAGWGDLAILRFLILEPGEIALRFASVPSLLDRVENPVPGSPGQLYGADWSVPLSIDRSAAERP